ncbi:MAG: hypothetical protein OHK0044_33400 [Burkholderiaceae bacterium]
MRRLWLVGIALVLAGCAAPPGPRSITLTPAEIERQIETDLGALMEVFRGLELRRPEVGLMPASERLQLAWNVRLPNTAPDAGLSGWLNARIEVSGKPVLNAAHNGVVLTQVTIDDVRLGGLPRLFGFSQLLDRKGSALPDFALIALPEDELKRAGVVYRATAVAVSYRGLRIDIEPK